MSILIIRKLIKVLSRGVAIIPVIKGIPAIISGIVRAENNAVFTPGASMLPLSQDLWQQTRKARCVTIYYTRN